MNVLVLSNAAADPQTGSGSAVSLVLDQLNAAGNRVEFFHLPMKGVAGTVRAARYLAPVQALRAAKRLLRRESYDLVICFGGEWGLFTAQARRSRRDWRLIQYSNGVESHAFKMMRAAEGQAGFPRRKWFQRGDLSRVHDLAFEHADHVVVLSEFDAAYLREELGLAPSAITVLSTPLPGYFLGLPLSRERPCVIGYCGSWLPRKNISLIASDVQAFLRDFPEWRFEAAGPGTENVAAAVASDVASRVRGLGPLPRERLPDWYRGVSISLVPSVYESLGLVAAEAMACGCAVVGSSGSAFTASLKHGEEVYLLNSTRSPELARALTELAQDRALRERIAAGGHARAQELSLDNWRARFSTVLEGA